MCVGWEKYLFIGTCVFAYCGSVCVKQFYIFVCAYTRVRARAYLWFSLSFFLALIKKGQRSLCWPVTYPPMWYVTILIYFPMCSWFVVTPKQVSCLQWKGLVLKCNDAKSSFLCLEREAWSVSLLLTLLMRGISNYASLHVTVGKLHKPTTQIMGRYLYAHINLSCSWFMVHTKQVSL
jgi:hypothetical protein